MGMDEDTVALFPDSFEDSELGPIPAGWKVGTISEFGKIVTGRTPSSKNLNTLKAQFLSLRFQIWLEIFGKRRQREPSLKMVQRL